MSNDTKKIKKATINKAYFVCAIIWYLAAGLQLLAGSNTGLAVTNFCVGSVWMILMAVELNKSRDEENTISFYNKNADKFIENTVDADMSETRGVFLEYVPESGRILDWGCGSGRDSLEFAKKGYTVESTDASEKMCEYSKKLTEEYADKIAVKCESFDELKKNNVKDYYDGIWACASLLHVNRDDLPKVLTDACEALKENGVMYASFKYGDFAGTRDGRYFTDLTTRKLEMLIKSVRKFDIVKQWITTDVREDKKNQQWVNVIVRKKTSKSAENA